MVTRRATCSWLLGWSWWLAYHHDFLRPCEALSSLWGGSRSSTTPSVARSSRFHTPKDNNNEELDDTILSRRRWIQQGARAMISITVTTTSAGWITTRGSSPSWGVVVADSTVAPMAPVALTGEALKLFQQGRALEGQGNMVAAQRLYQQVTRLAPPYVYGWSQLGNTQTALGQLAQADLSYSTALNLCRAQLPPTGDVLPLATLSPSSCQADLYLLLLNRGCVRLNQGQIADALSDLRQAATLRGQPDAVVLTNLARAEELSGLYDQADRHYEVALRLMNREGVSPVWLRAALVKYQLGQITAGYEVLKRVQQRFPEAPEVRAALAVFGAAQGQAAQARDIWQAMPEVARRRMADRTYLTETLAWPPAMIQALAEITRQIGDTSP